MLRYFQIYGVKKAENIQMMASITDTPAMLDAYEVLRQFIDATDNLENCVILVIAPPEFIEDEKRGVSRYPALKMRIWDEVRDRERDNPYAPLVSVSSCL